MNKARNIRDLLKLILTVASIIDIVVGLARQEPSFVSEFARAPLLILYVDRLRSAWKLILCVIWDSKTILVMMIGFVVFFGWMGFRLFRGTLEGSANFSTLGASCYNLYIMLMTPNFPNVMLPSYQTNSANTIFFLIFEIIGLYLMFNLVIAIIYSNYTNRADRQI